MKKKVRKTKTAIETRHKKIRWGTLVLSFLIIIAVAFLGSLFTGDNTKGEWYSQNKPGITPPNYVFPIVWNILFFLIALSFYFALVNSKKGVSRGRVILVFAVNFVSNVLWSLFFFTLKNPLLGFIDIVLVWLSALAMLIVSWRISKTAFWMLVPYLAWLSFAAILNLLFLI